MKNSNKHSKYKRIRKRILSVVMIFCMVLSILPQGTVAFAAGPEDAVAAEESMDHNHNGWQEWSEDGLPIDQGNYYLSKDIEIKSLTGKYVWEPSEGVILCLNGHTITCKAFISLVSGDVTIDDCDGKGSMVFENTGNSSGYSSFQVGDNNKAAKLTIKGGNFNRSDKRRSTIGVYNGSTLAIKGGSFTHDKGYAVELNIFNTILELSGWPVISGGAGDILDATGRGAEQGQIKVTGLLEGNFSLCIADLVYQLEYLHKYPFTSSEPTIHNNLENFTIYDIDTDDGLFNLNGIEDSDYVARKNLESGQLEVVERGPKVTLDYQRGDDEVGGEDDIKYLQYSKRETSYYGLPEEPTRRGYTFDGWYTEAKSGSKVSNSESIVSNKDHTLYAHWIANTYTVKYLEKSGAEVDGIDDSDKQYTFGGGLTLPTPTKKGYKFVGWFETSTCEGAPVTSPLKDYLPSPEDKTEIVLYAKWDARDYTIKYEKDGGEIDNESGYTSYTYGESLSLPTPTKKGHDFVGWFETSTCEGAPVTSPLKDYLPSPEDKTEIVLYAKWDARVYTIEYDTTGGTIDNESDYTSYTYGESLSLPTPIQKGHKFAGWFKKNDDGDDILVEDILKDYLPFPESTDEKISLYAKWDIATYTVTYMVDGEKIDNIESKYTSYKYGDGLNELPTLPTREGYIFDGWYAESDCSGEKVISISATDEDNKTFYAKWVAKVYTVRYETNDGTIAEGDLNTSYTYGEESPLPTPTKTGHKFVGWFKKNDNGDDILVEDILKDYSPFPENTGEEIVLYAKWEKATYTVTYLEENGSDVEGIDNDYKKYTYETGFTLPTPTKRGYIFEGWYDNEAETKTKVTEITDTDTGNKTYYAKWTARTYTVKYLEKEGGEVEGIEDSAKKYTYREGLNLPEPTKLGYDFKGWFETNNYVGTPVANPLTYYLPSNEEATEIVLYAKWENAQYPVKYKEKDESDVKDIDDNDKTYTYETGLTLPTPTKKGYTFDGWYKDSDFDNGPVTNIGTNETGEKTFYAKWTARTYTVKYLERNGVAVEGIEGSAETYTYGESFTLPTPIKLGYDFEGWFDETGDKVANPLKDYLPSPEDKTEIVLYAKWKNATYTVTYETDGGTIEDEGNYTSYTYGEGLILPIPTKTGYTFGGWYEEDSDFDDGPVTNIGTNETGEKTFYAKWEDDIAPVIEPLEYNYEPKSLWNWLIGKDSLVITVPVKEEGSGADEITYAITEVGESSPKEEQAAIQNGEAKITINADFKGTIEINCVDKAGNVAESVMVGGPTGNGLILEDNAPAVSFEETGGTIREDDYYNSAPIVKVTVADDIVLANTDKNAISSGIASITYQIDNDNKSGTEQTVTGDFTKGIVAQYSFMISPEEIPAGINTITMKVEDNAGNIGEGKLIVKVWGTDEDRVTEAKERLQEILDNLTVTNDTTEDSFNQQLQDALAEEGFGDVTVTVEDFHKDMATTDKEGKVTATVTVSKGDNSSEATAFDKNIDKLEPTPSTPPEQEPEQVPEQEPEQAPGQEPEQEPEQAPDKTPSTPSTETTIAPKEQEKNSIALMAGFKVSQTGKKISIKWGKVESADGYQVYASYCGKKFTGEPVKTVKSAAITKVNVTKLDGKKLNLKKNYKVYITAYKEVNGKKVVMGKTATGHIVGKNNKAYTNVKEVKVSKSKYTLTVGKTVKISAKTVLVDKTKKQLSNAHAKEFRYKSTDTSVAVVSKTGKITAKGKGTCIVYVYARNGYAKKVKVTVK